MMAGNITGVKELNQKFTKMDRTLANKVGARMVAGGATLVKNETKAIIRSKGLVKSGALVNNVVIKREKKAPNGTIQYNVGVRHGKALGNGKKVVKYLALSKTGRVITKRKNDPFYWNFLNFGTKYIAAAHYMEQGLDNKQQAVINQMGNVLDKDLLKANL